MPRSKTRQNTARKYACNGAPRFCRDRTGECGCARGSRLGSPHSASQTGWRCTWHRHVLHTCSMRRLDCFNTRCRREPARMLWQRMYAQSWNCGPTQSLCRSMGGVPTTPCPEHPSSLLSRPPHRNCSPSCGFFTDTRRRLDLVVYGATPLGGALCCDATLVSPLTRAGLPQRLAGRRTRQASCLPGADRRPATTRGAREHSGAMSADDGMPARASRAKRRCVGMG